MAGNLVSLSSNGIASGAQTVTKSGSERQVQKDVGDLGKALQTNDVTAAQGALAALKTAAPTQNGRTDFQNAVKALDQALKANDSKGATAAFANLQQATTPRRVQQQARNGQEQGANTQQHQAQPSALTSAPRQRPTERGRETPSADPGTHALATAEKAFITRRDLTAKAPSGVGRNIDTTA